MDIVGQTPWRVNPKILRLMHEVFTVHCTAPTYRTPDIIRFNEYDMLESTTLLLKMQDVIHLGA